MLSLILYLAILGFIVYLIVTYIPMPSQIRSLIVIVAVVLALIVVLQATGLIAAIDRPVPQIR